MTRLGVTFTLTALLAAPALAQPTLTLADAMSRARTQHPAARAAAAAERESGHRVVEARAGYFPRVDFTESWQRGDNPVFVFGTLLSQRRFTAADFALDRLNQPDPVNNFRSAFSVEQPLFDGGFTRLAVRRAGLGQAVARAGRERTEQDLALGAARAYASVVEAGTFVAAARAAVEAAESDLGRARNRRDLGLVTEADVLAVEVHLARVRQQLVQAQGDLRVATAQLNEAMGAPLDDDYEVAPAAPAPPATAVEALEQEALERRPEAREAALATSLAANTSDAARAHYMPQVGFQGGYEWNGDDWGSKVSSWVVGAQVRVNLFRGFGDKARLAAAREAETRAAAERQRIEQAVRLDVRAASTRLEAAQARETVGKAALAQARESQRIIRDRYEAGLATVTDVLRAAESVLQAESEASAARVRVLLQALELDRAVGRL
jgi:outer membrane protein TolC